MRPRDTSGKKPAAAAVGTRNEFYRCTTILYRRVMYGMAIQDASENSKLNFFFNIVI